MSDNIYDRYDYTEEDLVIAEYVGFPLYVSLRNRLVELECPIEMINTVIAEAIETHDIAAVEAGINGATIVTDASDPEHVKVWVEMGTGLEGENP